ncbi:unnamed protein product [Nesidiocoris tenuis]|uniref:FLYWCH-type domain-containing protein n=1 Tax=Nesidiocoris tenuis TaxID=355587 RepID=A0A6H5HQX7_9HEMI|nr:unnamed protein product [Nesidiocoris tenuis]
MSDKTMFVAGGSQRSGMVMFHNNFRFVRHKSLNDDVMRWTCAGRRKWGCKAFVKTSGSEVIDAREDHTHDLHNASVTEDMPRSAKNIQDPQYFHDSHNFQDLQCFLDPQYFHDSHSASVICSTYMIPSIPMILSAFTIPSTSTIPTTSMISSSSVITLVLPRSPVFP